MTKEQFDKFLFEDLIFCLMVRKNQYKFQNATIQKCQKQFPIFCDERFRNACQI